MFFSVLLYGITLLLFINRDKEASLSSSTNLVSDKVINSVLSQVFKKHEHKICLSEYFPVTFPSFGMQINFAFHDIKKKHYEINGIYCVAFLGSHFKSYKHKLIGRPASVLVTIKTNKMYKCIL